MKPFVNSCGLNVHEITHTGVKPFTCDISGMSYVQARGPKVHETIHM